MVNVWTNWTGLVGQLWGEVVNLDRDLGIAGNYWVQRERYEGKSAPIIAAVMVKIQ